MGSFMPGFSSFCHYLLVAGCVVQRSEQECMKLVGRVRLKLGSNRSLALLQPPSQQGYKYEEAPRAALPLTRHQCSIHCESSHVVHGASKSRWAAQTLKIENIFRCLISGSSIEVNSDAIKWHVIPDLSTVDWLHGTPCTLLVFLWSLSSALAESELSVSALLLGPRLDGTSL